jgi:glycosyltransferase involved in cell wall biosynthesis
MKVAAFTPGTTIPSARFRVRQFVEPLAELGIDLHELRSFSSSYPPASLIPRLAWGATRLAELAAQAVRSRRYDCVLLQREMISSFVTLEPWTGTPRLLDVDDSIHLLRGGRAARRLAEICDCVIAGNDWLAEWYSQWNRNIVVLPTAVDTSIYRPVPAKTESEQVVVGWIGTSANFVHLSEVEEALGKAFELLPGLSLKVVGDRPPPFAWLDGRRWQFVRWSEETELSDIQSMDIGIMPLAEERWADWARGKCSFKMLQYMACGLPVIVSPIGMNAQVLAQGEVGMGATGTGEWVEALRQLARSSRLRAAMGAAGRAVVERHYDTGVVAGRLASILRGVAGDYAPAIGSR